MLRAISDALNLSAETLLTQAGLLDQLAAATGTADAGEPDVPDTERAISADKRLTEDQKSALLAVYRSMLQQAG